MARIGEDFPSGGDLYEISEVHDADAIRDISYDREIMRDKEICQPLALSQVGQEIDDLCADGNVESRDTFIADDEARLYRQCARNADALPLPSGELVRISVDHVRLQPAFLHDGKDIRPHFGRSMVQHPMRYEPLLDDLPDRHARIQRRIRILEDDLQIAPQAAHLGVREAREFNTIVAQRLVPYECRIPPIGRTRRLQSPLDIRERTVYALPLRA